MIDKDIMKLRCTDVHHNITILGHNTLRSTKGPITTKDSER